MKKKLNLSIILFIVMSLVSCSDLLECAIKSVELKSKVLWVATKEKNYYETITADVNNDPNDGDYHYIFSISGKLPDGIESSSQGNKLILNGTATETGSFSFEVKVSVASSNENISCSSSDRKTYTLVVN